MARAMELLFRDGESKIELKVTHISLCGTMKELRESKIELKVI